MTQWSAEAKTELEEFLLLQRNALHAESGVDADEVIDNLRIHIQEEVRSRKLQVVTREDVKTITNGLGTSSDKTRSVWTQLSPLSGLMLTIFGVVLPTISILFELWFHLCARTFFDPIPTWWHVLLVSSVPVANALILYRTKTKRFRLAPFLTALNMATMIIACYYTIAFFVLLLPGMVTVFYFGFGLLPMGPLFAFIVTLYCRRFLSYPPLTRRYRWSLAGLLSAAALLGALELSVIVSRIGLQLADSKQPAVSQTGIELLRTLGSERTMLQACYERPRNITNLAALLLSNGKAINQQKAREVFYRVTGKPFNSVRPPRLYFTNGRWEALDNMTWDFDEGLGGTAVAGRVSGLWLNSSRLDGHIFKRAHLGYLEWTFQFDNQSSLQREARARILLPPGGIVSRLTLWVNGEEREAAFAGRQQTREAYQEVAVRQRKDPVLVTTSGPDQILMQCFPIPPDGGTMKVRIGITTPLVMNSPLQGRLKLPRIIERNFNLTAELKHSLWLQSQSSLSSDLSTLHSSVGDENEARLIGQIDDSELLSADATVEVLSPEPSVRVQTPGLDSKRAILQELGPSSPLKVDRLVLAVDDSKGIAPYLPEIVNGLKSLPDSIELLVITASASRDRQREYLPISGEEAARHINSITAVGGQDNLSLLVRAWELAAETPLGAVLWIHCPQPLLIGPEQALAQRLERSPSRPRIFGIQTIDGPNRIREKQLAIKSVSRFDTFEEDLTRWLEQLNSETGPLRFTRQAVLKEDPLADPETTPETTDHVRRLWAAERIELLASKVDLDAAIRLSAREQLVTSVSGAVVLETKEQFDRAGLTPVNPSTVPVIPEPETWLLMALSLGALWWLRRRQAAGHFCRR